MAECPEHEDLFEYALAGLEGEHRQKVKKHLGMCKGCQDQIAEYALVSEGLALKAPDVEPPATMQAGLMDRIHAEKRGEARAETPLDALRLGGWAAFWMRLGPVFAVMCLVMTGMAFLYMQKAAQFKVASESVLDHARLQSLMAGSQLQTVSLASPGGKGCSGSITCSKDSKYMLVSVDKLHRCPYGRVFMVWMEKPGVTPVRLASFVPSGEAPENFIVEVEHPVEDMSGMEVKVTLQAEASSAPEGELYLASSRL